MKSMRTLCRGRVGLILFAAAAQQRVDLGQTLLALALPAAIRQPVDAPARALQDRLCADALQRATVWRRGRLWLAARRNRQRLCAVRRDDIDLQASDRIVQPGRIAAMGA